MGEAASSSPSGDLRYVPQARRLPIEQQGRLTLYDTGEHQFCGVLEGHGADGASPPVSQRGSVALDSLEVVPL